MVRTVTIPTLLALLIFIMDGNLRDGIDRSQLAFEGRENEDVTVFLRELKRVANAQGRQRDNDWLVDTFEMCSQAQL
ncbi:hypothetical protein FRB94_001178 [Tulasnella sp. JGI-2019a]|nr:hypothetical protein FRB94_001178 [Tulasnella sp. JGI-2019a]